MSRNYTKQTGFKACFLLFLFCSLSAISGNSKPDGLNYNTTNTLLKKVQLLTSNRDINSDTLYFPSAFTPNGDGQNDTFRPLGSLPVSEYKLHIFNRWGQLIYTSDHLSNGWKGIFKGHKLPVGVYTWIAVYKRSNDGKNILQKGVVHLLR